MNATPDAGWPAVRALFEAALQRPATDRESFVRASGAAPAVQAEVLSLLAHSSGGASADPDFLGGAAREAGHAGLRLGAWELLSLLGSGGMGEVWRARRADGAYKGTAAVKLLKRGMDSAQVLQRFALERQALARLDHPHIARLFDAGLSAQGLPFFVMELVEGDSIDLACLNLPLEGRLTLFLQLADAVAHAHRHLLVHRDLKPGNVLVNRAGQVKLLDFGIAKALDPLEGGVGGNGDQTQAGQRPFTPSHASPEQVRGEPVSTATDIYSLGVLLYQLLTGQRPYGRGATTPAALARAVLDEAPTRPSSLEPQPGAEARWLATRQHLRGDLDNILLKTLEKDPARRYHSVDALAADLRAHLAGYPVSARAPRPGYLLSRFVRRNRLLVGSAALALLAVLGGAGLALWQARVAETQRLLAERRFEDVRQFARTMLFEVDAALRDGPTAGREKLVGTALQYLDRLAAERTRDAGLLRDVAEGYERIGDILGNTMQSNLGRPEQARTAYDKAMRVRETLAALAPDDLKNVQGLKSIHERFGDSARSRGDLPSARVHYALAAEHAATLSRARPDDLKARLLRIEADRYLASVDYWPFNPNLGRYAEARPRIEALDREMDELLRRHPDRPEALEGYGGLLNQLSDFQRIAGEYGASLATQRRSHALAERLLAMGPENPRWQRWLYLAEGRLADALIETGDTEAGLAMWRRSIAGRERVARADPENERGQRNVANGYGPLAEQLDALGRHAEALDWYQREFALLSRLQAKFPQVKALGPRLDESQRDLALQLSLNGRDAAALQQLQSLRQRRAARPAETDEALQARFELAEARIVLGPAGRTLPAAERGGQRERGEALLGRLDRAAAREPFNALLAREALLARYWLGQALHGGDAAVGCRHLASAAAGLTALQAQNRLPASLQPLQRDAARQAAGCGSTAPLVSAAKPVPG